ncbi:aspartate-semialdehyde dehydrogenase [Desulfitispora alkaliphila]|uniref:aspartate-semialdehyde dehydrogenase n=1 Tax=Desulfitispora alkaliphila TaxID=622674 RepID=UPI003D1D3B1B
MKKYNVAIVGTGAVGQELLNVLAERNFPINQLKLLATERSAGKEVQFLGETHIIRKTTPQEFAGVDIALFAGGGASKEYAKEAVKRGAVVVDNGSSFRMDPEVPLVVPEVNPEAVREHKGIIANPNCSTIQMVVALNPIHQKAKIKRVVVSTYQAVSGSGVDAIEELKTQSKDILADQEIVKKCYPHQIAYNMLPHIDVFLENDYSKEEMKMVNETKKIMGSEEIKVTATTVRVPVANGHSESINIETEKKLSAKEAKEILAKAPGIILEDDPMKNIYPMPINVQGRDEVFVGRIRDDHSIDNGLNMWVVADNLRKGAATNTIQIAELLVKESLV